MRRGAQLLPSARAVLAEADCLASRARSLATGAAGRMVLGFSPNGGPFGARAIAAIGDSHPDVEIVG